MAPSTTTTTTSVFGSDGIYRSPRPPVDFPSDSDLSLVSFLFRRTNSFPDRLALVDADSGETFTFSHLRSIVSRASYGLNRLGVRRGDVVLIFSPNCILFPVCFLAVISIGAVVTTVNPVYTVAELSKQAKDSKASLVIAVPELWEKVSKLLLPTVLLSRATGSSFDPDGVRVSYFSDLVASDGSSDLNLHPAIARQTDVAALIYSSGTTGASKGVVLTHRNLICTALMVTSDQDRKGDSPNVFLCFLPLFHIFGFSIVSYSQLCRGNTVVIMGRFEMDAMLRSIERYRVTHLYAVPPVMIALAKQGKVTKYDLSSLKFLGSGAAPLGKDVMDEVSKIFTKADIVQGYGMTESCGIISLEYVNGEEVRGSTGVLVPGVEGKVVNIDTLELLPPNQLGELCFRGPNIMQGYFNNVEATDLTLREGWLHTGDLGYFDEKGHLFVVDRIKELIKYKGFQIAPAELEALLLTHPEIVDAAVIPYPDAEAGEVPIAFVVRSPCSTVCNKALGRARM